MENQITSPSSKFTQSALIIGGSSTIAVATLKQILLSEHIKVFVISRAFEAELWNNLSAQYPSFNKQCTLITCNNTESSISAAVTDLKNQLLPSFKSSNTAFEQAPPLHGIYLFNGVLHGDNIQPEKKLEEINLASLRDIFEVNTFMPALWLKYLIQLLSPQPKADYTCVIVLLSARVGSIEDNKLGGWYSYRMTKSALNMLVKTAAIEYKRRIKNTHIVAFHPGTTDSPLSKPFQKNVKPQKLFTADFVAQKLLHHTHSSQLSTEPSSFIDWQGKTIPW